MKNFLLIVFSLSLHTLVAQSAFSCATDSLWQRYLLDHPGAQEAYTNLRERFYPNISATGTSRSAATLTIPVVVHIIHHGDPVGQGANISNARIAAQFAFTNAELTATNPNFSNVPTNFQSAVGSADIELCLATTDAQGLSTSGITRSYYPAASIDLNFIENTIKPALAWDPMQYLNVYVVEVSPIGVGYAYLPASGFVGTPADGIVCATEAFGSYATGAVYPTTLVHEIGHYLGLLHTFDGYDCNADDGITDTPNTDTPSSDYISPTACASLPLPTYQRCGNAVMYFNFMDYAYADCPSSFSSGQIAVMRNTLEGTTPVPGFAARTALLSNATACVGPEVCDGFDNDGDGQVDNGITQTYYIDNDDDGYGDIGTMLVDCEPPAGYVTNADDCDDNDAAISPAALDFPCNGIDEDCDGSDAVPNSRLYVTEGGTGDGSSWTQGIELRDALTIVAAACGVTELWVAAGTYKPTSGTDRNVSFKVTTDVSIYGGFPAAGTATSLGDRDPDSHPTILSGDIGMVGVDTDNSYHVVRLGNATRSMVLDGFIIEQGYADGTFIDSYGGGLFNNGIASTSGSNPTLRHLVFRDNFAINGGGMSNFTYVNGYATPLLENCRFEQNEASNRGGAVYDEGNNGGRAEPIYNDCVFTQNQAGQAGGALYSYKTHPSTVRVRLVNCILYQNSAIRGAAIFAASNANLLQYDILNCTFSGQQVTLGLGTVFTASLSCGGQNCGDVTAVFTNSILWDVAPQTIVAGGNATPVTYQHAIVRDYTGNNPGVSAADPLLLASPLLGIDACSPAVDAGTSNAAVLPTDLLGLPRNVGTSVDLGAYEIQQPAPPYFTDSDGDGYGDPGTATVFCSPPGGWTLLAGDCDDSDAAVYPGAPEIPCNGIDEDCDGSDSGFSTARLYVRAGGTGDGSSWASAIDLAPALQLVNYCAVAELWIAGGTYYPTASTDRTSSFLITSDAKIYGGFDPAGTATQLGERNPLAYPTVLSGDIGVAGDVSDNSYQVVHTRDLTAAAELHGLTIQNGNANGGTIATNRGGGWFNEALNTNSNPRITDCRLIDNYGFYGGGFHNRALGGYTASPDIISCVFDGNVAYQGGAINNDGQFGPAVPRFINCLLINNSATNQGGAAVNFGSGGSLLLLNCTVATNTASTTGGIRNLSGSNTTLTNSILWNNGTELAGNNFTINQSIVQGATAGPGLNLDPLFTNLAAGDYTLQNTSPARDIGVASPLLPANDLVGNPRLAGTGVDLGAYEIQAALPVDLIAFDAFTDGCERIQLAWETSYEYNNAYFWIERSLDAKDWLPLSRIQGQGTNLGLHRYNYTDELRATAAYYRLRQVDYDGTETLSSVRYVAAEHCAETLEVWPNPTSDYVQLSGFSPDKYAQLSIYDALGRCIQTTTVASKIDLSHLPGGVYHLVLHGATPQYAKVVKE